MAALSPWRNTPASLPQPMVTPAASARDEQSIERKGLLSELHALHLQASKLDEQVRLGQQALLVEEQKRQAVLGEREAEQRQATQLRAQLDDSHRVLMTNDDQ